ncbi:MAG: ABC transporter ATP-binding protein [Pseudomonadota bacterium]
MTALALKGVSHRFGDVVAVNDVTMSVGAGEIVCLLGPSGCGKSTLLRIAAGLEDVQQGSVVIGNRTAADATTGRNLPPEERDVGFVFQDYALFPHLSSVDNVAFGLRGESHETREARAMAALARVGMADLAKAYPHTLSGGQQQRVALARAVCPEPRVLLLDEPVSGLDARHRHRVAEETWRLLKESGAATLVVTHDPEEAMYLADRIAVMRAGRIEQAGPPADLYARPTTAFVLGFLSDVNRLKGFVNENNEIETPFGTVPANGLDVGAPAVVLVRQEGLVIETPLSVRRMPAKGYACRVLSDRSLGSASLVHIEPEEGADQSFYSRMPGNAFFEPGERIFVALDPSHTFVFPARQRPEKS